MLSRFLNYFNEHNDIEYSGNLYLDFVTNFGGKSFGDGIFNVFSAEEIDKWNGIVSEAYPEAGDKFKVFGYDWLGRCFGIDLSEETYGNVLVFEIGTGYVLEIPCEMKEFLNQEIPLYSEACLSRSFFDEYMKYSKKRLERGRCAGYKIPLFLGGDDTVENLEDSDMEVYWVILSQIKD